MQVCWACHPMRRTVHRTFLRINALLIGVVVVPAVSWAEGAPAEQPAAPPKPDATDAGGSAVDRARRAGGGRPSHLRRAAPSKRLPDVRRGEPYDGRVARPTDHREALQAPVRALLFVPRATLGVVMNAAVTVTDWLERGGVIPFIRRVFWAWNGRLRIVPVGGLRTDFTPMAGGWVASDLLFGKSRRAGLVAEGAYGDVHTWRTRLRVFPLGLGLSGRPALLLRWRLTLDVGYETREDAPFFGLGYLRPLDGSQPLPPRVVRGARLHREHLQATTKVRVRLWQTLRLQLRLGYDWRRFSDGMREGGDPPFSEVYGIDWPAWNEGLHAFVAALRLSWGGPIGKLVPPEGLRASMAATAFAGPLPESRLLQLGLDLEGFVDVGHGLQLLGLRGRLQGVGDLDHAPIPIPYLPRLGGRDTMRGFSAGRFRGETVAWLALEYYAALHPRLWLCLFLDGGGAFREQFRSASVDRLDVSGGGWLGLRIAPGAWLMVQVAGSRDGPEVFFGMRSEP